MAWTHIRDFVNQGIETHPVDASAFLSMPDSGIFETDANRLGYVEICFDGLSLSGAPTDVTFGVWRFSEGHIDKLLAIKLTAAQRAAPMPTWFPFHGQTLWLTVDAFGAGTSPTLSGSARCRPIRP